MVLHKDDAIKEPIWNNIPWAMQSKNHWIMWKAVPDKKDQNKINKVPYTPKGKPCSGNYQEGSQYSFDEVKDAYKKGGFDGVGFVFNQESGLTAVDLDDDSIDSIPEQYKKVSELSYAERSVSGNGLHVYIEGKRPEGYKNKSKDNKLEVYDEKRFMVVTGDKVNELPVMPRQKELDEFVKEHLERVAPAPSATPVSVPSIGGKLSDEELKERLKSEKRGRKLIDLLNKGQASEYAHPDHSRTDFRVICDLLYYTGKDVKLTERVFKSSAVFRKEDAGKFDRSIQSALNAQKTVYTPPVTTWQDQEWAGKLTLKNGKILESTNNLWIVLENDPVFTGLIGFNDLKISLEVLTETERIPDLKKGELTDPDVMLIKRYLDTLYFTDFPKRKLSDTLDAFGEKHKFNPVKDMLESIEWDKTPRLDTSLIETFGLPDDSYHRRMTGKLFASIVARGLHPGCKNELLFILSGTKKLGKTRFMERLALNPDYFYSFEGELNTSNKDVLYSLNQHWIVELGEGKATRQKDVNARKQFLSLREDKIRLPYAQRPITIKRKFAMVVTTNDENLTTDDERRLIELSCDRNRVAKPEYEWTDYEFEQLLAEAVYLYKKGEIINYFDVEKDADLYLEYQANVVAKIDRNDANIMIDNLFLYPLPQSIVKALEKGKHHTVREYLENPEAEILKYKDEPRELMSRLKTSDIIGFFESHPDLKNELTSQKGVGWAIKNHIEKSQLGKKRRLTSGMVYESHVLENEIFKQTIEEHTQLLDTVVNLAKQQQLEKLNAAKEKREKYPSNTFSSVGEARTVLE